MVEHRSEKPGVDSSILSLGIFHLKMLGSGLKGRFCFANQLKPQQARVKISAKVSNNSRSCGPKRSVLGESISITA